MNTSKQKQLLPQLYKIEDIGKRTAFALWCLTTDISCEPLDCELRKILVDTDKHTLRLVGCGALTVDTDTNSVILSGGIKVKAGPVHAAGHSATQEYAAVVIDFYKAYTAGRYDGGAYFGSLSM